MGPLRARAVRLAWSRPPDDALRRVLLAAVFPSTFDIGDPVWVVTADGQIAGHVRSVSFSTGKVRYAVQVLAPDGGGATLRAVDSALLVARPDGGHVEYGYDGEG